MNPLDRLPKVSVRLAIVLIAVGAGAIIGAVVNDPFWTRYVLGLAGAFVAATGFAGLARRNRR